MLNPVTPNYKWNYSRPNDPGYSTQLIGTVATIQEVQKMKWTPDGRPGVPEFWPDGNPMLNIRMLLIDQNGDFKSFTFQPAGRAAKQGLKPSIHMDLFHLLGDMDALVGRTICISTVEGSYGQGNPRPWHVELVDAGPFEAKAQIPDEYKVPQLLANTAVSGGQVQAPQPQPQQPQQFYTNYLGQPQTQYDPQLVQQQYAQQHPAYQPPVQTVDPNVKVAPMPYQAPAPTMDPNVAAAMQQMGATNIQEVQTPIQGQVYTDPYEDETPF